MCVCVCLYIVRAVPFLSGLRGLALKGTGCPLLELGWSLLGCGGSVGSSWSGQGAACRGTHLCWLSVGEKDTLLNTANTQTPVLVFSAVLGSLLLHSSVIFMATPLIAPSLSTYLFTSRKRLHLYVLSALSFLR